MTRTNPIQAISFDVGGTLIEPWPSVGHVYAEVASRHGILNADPELLNRRFAEAWRTKLTFDYSRASWAEIVAKTFQRPAVSEQESDFFADLYERFAEPEAWRIYEDVRPTLEELTRRGVKLAVISNWDERLRPLLRKLKLDRFFEVIVVSSELGQHKPSPAIFHQALDQLRLPPDTVLHVGDSAREDLEGAQRAGMRAVLLNQHCTDIASGAIHSLLELLPFVG